LEHPDFVKCVCVAGSLVITGARDEQIRVWDSTNGKCMHIFEGHFDEVSSLKVVGTTLYSASLDGTIRTWDLNGKKKSIPCNRMDFFFAL
jgi:WD40 repeat protein